MKPVRRDATDNIIVADAVTWALRAVYRTLELPGRNPLKEAHGGLDEAVMRAYGFSGKKDLLGQLLELNLEVSRREQLGERLVGPGVPEGYGDGAGLVSGDCVGNDE